MSDLIEFKTSENKRKYFHKVTSNGIIFYIKGLGPAFVILAESPEINEYCFELKLSNEGCKIKYYYKTSDILKNHSLLSNSMYAKFWASWSTGGLKVGKADDAFPILQFDFYSKGFKNIFVSFQSQHEVSWKFYVPPQLGMPVIQNIQGGKPHWVKMGDQLPDDAFIGGHENEMLYIMRSSHGEALVPGKFVPSKKKGFIIYGSSVLEKNYFEILCGYDLIWLPLKNDRIPAGAVEGGVEEDKKILFVGRAMHEGHVIPGVVSNGSCIIVYQGKLVKKNNCDILVQPFNKGVPVRNYYDSDDYDEGPLNSHDADFWYGDSD